MLYNATTLGNRSMAMSPAGELVRGEAGVPLGVFLDITFDRVAQIAKKRHCYVASREFTPGRHVLVSR
jgi:hypothetical protein